MQHIPRVPSQPGHARKQVLPRTNGLLNLKVSPLHEPGPHVDRATAPVRQLPAATAARGAAARQQLVWEAWVLRQRAHHVAKERV